jgi:hypothetical protein
MGKPQPQSGRDLPHPFSGLSHLTKREKSVARLARFSIAVAAALLCALALPTLAADGAIGSKLPQKVNYILVGFAGGFVHHDNPHHGPVQLAERLRRSSADGTYVEVFENRHRKKAYKTILRLLDKDHDGTLSEAEKAQAHVILFGHSWGAAAVVLLARELDHAGVPVLLTVQVDSVAKLWQHDGVIPDNVEAAVNFYQPHGLIHGRSEIKAEDQSKTQILGNYRFDYRQTPVQCEGITWFDRTFMPSHIQSQCDPRLWNQVEQLMREKMQPAASIATVAGQ